MRWAAPLCAASIASAPAHPVLTFTEQIVTHPSAPGAASAKPGTEQFRGTVTLGRKYLRIDAQNTRQIYAGPSAARLSAPSPATDTRRSA